MKENGNESKNRFTTVRLDRDFVEEMQEQMDYNDDYDSFLKQKLNFD